MLVWETAEQTMPGEAQLEFAGRGRGVDGRGGPGRGGTPYFPPPAKSLDPRLAESRTLSSRVVHLRYQRIR